MRTDLDGMLIVILQAKIKGLEESGLAACALLDQVSIRLGLDGPPDPAMLLGKIDELKAKAKSKGQK